MTDFRRKTPEEILLSIAKLHRGRLKIYVGPVSGSGKTYQMLREGQTLKRQGIDVVISAVSARQPETAEQAADLERVPSIRWTREGAERQDLNLEALDERHPEVVLVDGLAHRNRTGARFPTRLADIRYLLGRGISVITTVNVYELAGMAELAKRLTGIAAEETISAEALELADEIRLVDVTPETLLERLAEGRLPGCGESSFFQLERLGKLRELALRLVAEGVGAELAKQRAKEGLPGPSGAAERILVAAQYYWNGSLYVRRGQQIAKRLNGDLHVVTFVRPGKPLSAEQAAFKRSLLKLAEKVGASFAELPLKSQRALPRRLVRYAAQRGVTRIVLGHSQQSRWQEWRRGSVVNRLLQQARGIDLYFVADRARYEGERILPAKRREPGHGPDYHRLSGKEIEERISRMRRGKLKIYIGAAPGVGKTYAMLREGNDLLNKGIGVVIGLVETHGRAETASQIGNLPIIPRQGIEYRGARLEEMDTNAIAARNPEVVLIDELAHTNAPGSKHRKRYEDVRELLDAGISVITTVNVQHLESLNDAVEQIAGVRVRETVPDRMLREADEVVLVDIAPDSLRQRMMEGKIYAPHKVDQALSHFFRTRNLIALRELALREIADEVDERLEAWERVSPLRGPWRRRESIFVGVTLSANAERLIRRGFRIAHRLKADWCVAYVHRGASVPPALTGRVAAIRELAERLGGAFEVRFAAGGRRIPGTLLAGADERRSTQIIVGQSRRSWWQRLRHGSVVRPILRSARHMDVLVVADFAPETTAAPQS